MHANQVSTAWTAARGAKWRANSHAMEAMLYPVDEPLISALNLDTPCRIADIGCGGGATTREIVRHAPPGSVVEGFDISPDLIQLANSNQRPDQPAIAFHVADMATAAPPGSRYDRLVSRFGTMFFPDPPAAFANLMRWLVPGGRFAFAVWGPPTENEWISNVRHVVHEVVGLPTPVADAPGPFRYADPEKLVSLLKGVGCRDLAVHHWRGTLAIGGGMPAREAATFALASFSNFAEALAAAGEEALRKAQQILTDRFRRHERGGEVCLRAFVHIVTGASSQ